MSLISAADTGGLGYLHPLRQLTNSRRSLKINGDDGWAALTPISPGGGQYACRGPRRWPLCDRVSSLVQARKNRDAGATLSHRILRLNVPSPRAV